MSDTLEILVVKKIKFRSNEGHPELSNFYPCEFVWKDTKFNCAEQAFQWSKAKMFKDEETASKILLETNPVKIKHLGKKVKNYNEIEWNKIKVKVMSSIVSSKFNQNKNLQDILIATKDSMLGEASKNDYFWGLGEKGTGKNILGQILMQYRNNIIGGLND